jgi:hypothetical protein
MERSPEEKMGKEDMKSTAFEPKILAFCCHYCAYSSADLAGSMRIQYPPNVRIIRTPCTGRLEAQFFMKALFPFKIFNNRSCILRVDITFRSIRVN